MFPKKISCQKHAKLEKYLERWNCSDCILSEKTLGLIKKLLATSTSMHSQTLQKVTRYYEVAAVTKNKQSNFFFK